MIKLRIVMANYSISQRGTNRDSFNKRIVRIVEYYQAIAQVLLKIIIHLG